MQTSSTNKFLIFVIISSMIIAPVLYVIGPIYQPLVYHHFADFRTMFNIPNAMNVLSNVAFFIAGAYGIYQVQRTQRKHKAPSIYGMYYVFFIAVALTTFSSGYYHLNPNNLTLFWDRVTISIATVAFMNAIILERIRFKFDMLIYFIFLILAALTVVYWEYTEMIGQGDLRLYGTVQILPVIVMIFMASRYPKVYPGIQYLVIAFLCFIAMRICEITDKPIFSLTTHIISGHTLKHIFAAVGVIFVALYVKARQIPLKRLRSPSMH